jgi:hypothetical protein
MRSRVFPFDFFFRFTIILATSLHSFVDENTMACMHACANPQEGSWTPTAELPLRQGPAVDDDLPQVVVQEKQLGGGSAATRTGTATATATRDGSVGWSGKPCRRDKSGGWFAGFLMLGKST